MGSSGEAIVHQYDETKHGDFRDPAWTLVKDINGLLGCAPQTWARGEYTALGVAGPGGEAMRERLQANARATADRLWKMLGG